MEYYKLLAIRDNKKFPLHHEFIFRNIKDFSEQLDFLIQSKKYTLIFKFSCISDIPLFDRLTFDYWSYIPDYSIAKFNPISLKVEFYNQYLNEKYRGDNEGF